MPLHDTRCYNYRRIITRIARHFCVYCVQESRRGAREELAMVHGGGAAWPINLHCTKWWQLALLVIRVMARIHVWRGYGEVLKFSYKRFSGQNQ